MYLLYVWIESMLGKLQRMMSEVEKKYIVKKDEPGGQNLNCLFKDSFLFYFEGHPNWDLENQKFSFYILFWVL